MRTAGGRSAPDTPRYPANPSFRVVCIVSFLNEARHLATFLASIGEQARFPDLLVLVDDGSSDDSPRLASAFAKERDDVLALRRPSRPLERDRLARAPELRAFLWATEQLALEWDVVVKMDADLKLSPDLFRTMELAFRDNPALGIAGTYLSVIDERTGEQRRERCRPDHVRGATKFYRRPCFEQLAPIEPVLGWDTIDEIAARMHGWQTLSFECPRGDTIHLRPTGVADGRLRAQYRWGACAYAIGQHPLWVLLSAARRASDSPRLLGALAFLSGWGVSTLRRGPRAAADVREFGRGEQLVELRRQLVELRRRVRAVRPQRSAIGA